MIASLNKLVEKALFWSIAVIHGVIAAVLFAGVVTRYVFNAPLFWSEEICILALVWITFLGGAVLVRQDKNICITVFTDHLSARMKRRIELVNHPIIIVCLVVMIVQSWRLTERLSLSTTPALRMNESWFGVSLLIGFVVMLFYQVQRFIAQLRNRTAFPDQAVCSAEEKTGEVCNL